MVFLIPSNLVKELRLRAQIRYFLLSKGSSTAYSNLNYIGPFPKGITKSFSYKTLLPK